MGMDKLIKNASSSRKKKIIGFSILFVVLVMVAGGVFFIVKKGKETYIDPTLNMQAKAEELKASLNEFADNIKKGENIKNKSGKWIWSFRKIV